MGCAFGHVAQVVGTCDLVAEGLTRNGVAFLSGVPAGGTGFTGYLTFDDERSGASGADAGVDPDYLLPARLSVTLSLVDKIRYYIEVPRRRIMDILLGAVDAGFDSQRGYVFVQAVDCHGEGARGVVVESTLTDDLTRRDYWGNGGPDLDLQATLFGGVSFNFLPAGQAGVFRVKDASGRTLSKIQTGGL